jgi:hypothetical protein
MGKLRWIRSRVIYYSQNLNFIRFDDISPGFYVHHVRGESRFFGDEKCQILTLAGSSRIVLGAEKRAAFILYRVARVLA